MVQITSDAENADRHVALRVLRFLRRGRNRVESDIGEENRCRSRGNAVSMPKRPGPSYGGIKGCQLIWPCADDAAGKRCRGPERCRPQ